MPRPIHLSAPAADSPPAVDSPVRTGLQCRGQPICCLGESGDIHPSLFLTHSIFVKEQFIFALVCTIVDAGHVFTTSKQTWLTRSRRFTAPQPVHLFELPLTPRVVFSICLLRPGLHRHTRTAPVCMSGLLNMSKSLLGKPGFSSNSLEENCHVLSAAVGTGRLKGHAHKSPSLQFG